ncbi:putative RNA splicing factor [Heterostelium album PN500]|uniref:Splicing factor YJU2 n=1 Tax=Heterostelium pallidum (strain ATCC 26659 / Pp 5 / PN500) TaxID=670386 RepID=D3BTV0_HETP5|nr:putative RNA splicing factor [Heterostelium album PN500]EFA75136.1 putative RNA splicing factor [Heterostelium album PN500]|eukprot:XP_020427270.1 putative RNA splicing factor [Heterostelium album PN500]
MGERKVISKYYPPEFDPSKIPRAKGVKKSNTIKVTMMLPMSIRCNTCGEYLGRGTKFNSRKETVEGENYLGLKIFRFYLRCKKCAAELSIRTDPKNSEYVCESGATRNYEPWRETDEDREERLKREKEEEGDAMKALENRTLDSKREMEILDALDELKDISARNAEIDPEMLLQYSLRKQEELDQINDLEDQALIYETFGKSGGGGGTGDSSTLSIKRIEDKDPPLTDLLESETSSLEQQDNKKKEKTSLLKGIKLTVNNNQDNNNNNKKRTINQVDNESKENELDKKLKPTTTTTTPTQTTSSLFAEYGSDDEDD